MENKKMDDEWTEAHCYDFGALHTPTRKRRE